MSELKFTVDSALLSELGEKLVQSVHIALVELIKNAYDADATEVVVKFERDTKQGFKVEISDNGSGMNHEEIKKYWMRIATTNKVENLYSKLYGRKKTGAKGIGRFCCRRLGAKLKLETTGIKNNKYEYTAILFDWSKFVPGEDVSTISVNGDMSAANHGKQGTTLIITGNNKDEWSNRGYDYVKRQLSQLVSNRGRHIKGYDQDPGFNIVIYAEGTRMATKDLRNDVMEAGWGVLTGAVSNKGVATYNLNALDIGNKIIEGDNIYKGLEGINFKIGIFPARKDQWRNNKILLKKSMNETLEEWGGVQVNLNNFKIYIEEDWLDIDRDRALSKGSVKGGLIEIAKKLKGINPSRALLSMLSSRSYLGTVEITTDLKGFEPKLNREGFLDSKETTLLRDFVRYGIDWSSIYRDYFLRQLERKEINEAENNFINISGQQDSSSKEIVKSAINYIETEISRASHLLPNKSKKEFHSIISNFKSAKETIFKISAANEEELHHLRLIASTSTLLLIFNHEVKSLLSILERSKNTLISVLDIVSNKEKDGISNVITELGDSKTRFSNLINMTALIGVDSINAPEIQLVIKKHIRKAIDCFRLIIDKYFINIDIDSIPDNETVGPMQEAEFYAVILNILSNSIKAVLASSQTNKIIKIDYIKDKNEHKLIFLDNGIGLSQSYFEEVFIPFIADPEKTLYKNLDNKLNQEDRMIVGSGSGLGLSIVKEILVAKRGSIYFKVPRKGWRTELEVIFR